MGSERLIKRGIFVGVLMSIGIPMAQAKDRENVTISYVIPSKQALPPGIRTLTVVDFGAISNEPQAADMRALKWSAIGADLTEAMLRASTADGSAIIVTQRSQTRQAYFNQEDTSGSAGLLRPEAATRLGTALNVNALAVGDIEIQINDLQGRRRVNWDRILGGVGGRPSQRRYEPRYQRDGDWDRDRAYYRGSRRYGGRALNMSPSEIDEVNRALSVKCTFALLDSANGQPIAQYTPPAMQRRDNRPPNFAFGRYMPDQELNPIDYFIGELVERAAQDFVNQIAPTRVEVTYLLEGSGKDYERGLRYYRQRDYRRAYDAFEDAHQDERDDAEYPFAMGVMAELMGDLPRALDLYRRATTSEDIDDDELPQYLEARDRLAAHLGRGPIGGGFTEVRPITPMPPPPPSGRPYSPPPTNYPPPPPPQQHAGRNCVNCGYGPITYAKSVCPRCGRHPDHTGPQNSAPPVIEPQRYDEDEPGTMQPETNNNGDRDDDDRDRDDD